MDKYSSLTKQQGKPIRHRWCEMLFINAPILTYWKFVEMIAMTRCSGHSERQFIEQEWQEKQDTDIQISSP
jgi:hypothetical protein